MVVLGLWVMCYVIICDIDNPHVSCPFCTKLACTNLPTFYSDNI